MSCIIVPEVGSVCGGDTAGFENEELHVMASSGRVAIPDPDVDSHTISTAPTLTDGASEVPESWTFAEETLVISEERQDNGKVTTTVTGKIGGDSALKRYITDKMANGCCKFDVWATDANGHTLYIPDMKFSEAWTSGEASAKNEYTMTFTKTGKKGYTYTAAIPTGV